MNEWQAVPLQSGYAAINRRNTMSRTYNLCLDAECKIASRITEDDINRFFERLSWI